jgi:hypothetical protein
MEISSGSRKENFIEMVTYRLEFFRVEASTGARKEKFIEMVTCRL